MKSNQSNVVFHAIPIALMVPLVFKWMKQTSIFLRTNKKKVFWDLHLTIFLRNLTKNFIWNTRQFFKFKSTKFHHNNPIMFNLNSNMNIISPGNDTIDSSILLQYTVRKLFQRLLDSFCKLELALKVHFAIKFFDIQYHLDVSLFCNYIFCRSTSCSSNQNIIQRSSMSHFTRCIRWLNQQKTEW